MIAATVAGAALIALTGADVLLTVLHPTRTGPLSRLAMAAVWRSARTLASRLRTEAPIGYGGTVAMLAQLLTWVLGLWVGFALIYAGHLDRLGFSPQLDFGDRDLLDALYLSAAALTTVGFGDLVAATDALRLVTVVEAASGLAVITAAISYLLSVYPLASEIRVAGRQLAPAQAGDRGAAELVVHGGRSRLLALQRDLIQLDESTQRFPVLYYFHAEDSSASLAAVIRASSAIVMQLRFGLSARAVPHARWNGEVLEATLTRVIEHFGERFHARAGPDRERLPGEAEVDRRLAELRRAAARVTGVEADDEPDREALANLLARSNSFLAELEHRHLYPHEPL